MEQSLWLLWPVWQLALSLGAVALLFGGMTLFAFGFAALVFTALPQDLARSVIRRAFPPFYIWVILTAAIAAGLLWTLDAWSAWLMALVALSTIPTRQVLMPAINATSDAGNLRAFRWLHGASVLITLLHIAATAAVLVRFVV
ncbi:MAG: DUF4149 domain-containing protein [Betaproteobacteria bacterium]|jgi:hypothetical protein